MPDQKHVLTDGAVFGMVISTTDTPVIELTGFSYDFTPSTADDRSTADGLNPNRLVEMVDFNSSGDYMVVATDPAIEALEAAALAGTPVEGYIEITFPLLGAESVAATKDVRGTFIVGLSNAGTKGSKITGTITLTGACGAMAVINTPATP